MIKSRMMIWSEMRNAENLEETTWSMWEDIIKMEQG
jgi:hypothetical protein